jgi:hypothetical protein
MSQLPPTNLRTTLYTNMLVGNVTVIGDVTSNVIRASNVTSTGNVYATYFIGDGSQLSGVSGLLDVVNVRSIDDFPAPQDGVIQLGNDMSYWISGYVDLHGNSLLCANNTSIVGLNPYGSFLVSDDLPTDTAMIKSNVNSIVISNMQLRAPNLINYINVFENFPTYGMQIQNCILFGSSRLATIDGINVLEIDSCQTSNSGTMLVNGNVSRVYLHTSTFEGQDLNSIITFGPTCNITNRVRVLDCAFDTKNTGNVIYVSNTTAFSRPEAVVISDCYATSSRFVQGAMTPTSVYLKSFNNMNLQNSLAIGHATLSGNATVSTPTTGQFYPVTGPWLLGPASSKFTTDGNGRLTYVGYGIQRFLADVTLSFSSATNNDTCGFGIYSSVTGNVFVNSIQYQECTSITHPEIFATKYLFTANTGDYMQVYGTNLDAAGGFTVQGGNFIVQAV